MRLRFGFRGSDVLCSVHILLRLREWGAVREEGKESWVG